MSLMTSEVARLAGVNKQTLRYYERRGLLPRTERNMSGHRLYDPAAVLRLRFIKRAQDLGFGLSEIEELLSLQVEEEKPCEDIRAVAEAKIVEIEDKVRDLMRMKEKLVDLVEACLENKDTEGCPVLDSFEQDPDDHKR